MEPDGWGLPEAADTSLSRRAKQTFVRSISSMIVPTTILLKLSPRPSGFHREWECVCVCVCMCMCERERERNPVETF